MAGIARIAKQLGIEAAGLALMLAGLAGLTRTLPWPAPERAAVWRAAAGDWQVAGVLRPARLGLNTLEVRVLDAAGRPLAGAAGEVTLLPVGGGALTARRTLTPVADTDVYGAASLNLTRAGPWQMLIQVRPPDGTLAYAVVDWVVGLDGGAWLADETRPVAAQWRGWLNGSGPGAAAMLAGALTLAWGWRAWRRWPRN